MITKEQIIDYLQTVVQRGGSQFVSTKDLERIGLPFEVLLTGRVWTSAQAEQQLELL